MNLIAAPEKLHVFLGTYTEGESKGIYDYELDLKAGTLKKSGLAAETPGPSFLAISPNKRFLYAVNEVDTFKGKKAGSISGFSIDPHSGKLTAINQSTSGGPGPCFVTVDQTGRNVLVANYGGGSVCVVPINDKGELAAEPSAFVQHTGSSVNKERQSEPHAHSIYLDPSNRFAIAADLGLDKLLVYRFDAQKGTLSPNLPPSAAIAPGSGPRHVAFHPNGKDAYVITEMLCTIEALSYNSQAGSFKTFQTVEVLPNGVRKGDSGAEIEMHPSGKFLYASIRGANLIAIFSIGQDGKLKYLKSESTRGKTPRNFAIDPTGQYLIAANQDSDSLALFRIDANTGLLSAVGDVVHAPKPVCVTFWQAQAD
jgi:6-phosphogluconolactonase